MIGYATLKTEELEQWLNDERAKLDKATRESWDVPMADKKETWANANWTEYFYKHTRDFEGCLQIIDSSSRWNKEDRSIEFWDLLNRLNTEGQRIMVFYHDDFATSIGFSNKRYIVPSKFVLFEPLKDYSDCTTDDMSVIGNSDMTSMLPSNMKGSSMSSLKDELDGKKEQIRAAEEECKRKIEEIRQEALRKEQELKELLEKETEKLRLMKEELENKIFILDTQIYGIRCYLGEVIDFTKIRDGKPAKGDTPVVVFQKIRYLDEELGKYFSLYNMTSNNNDTICSILKNRDDIRDIFCPAERSVSVIKCSRTGTFKETSERTVNILKDYEYLHAKQMAILIRDGENLFIGWTDEEKIQLSSEDFFLKAGVTTIEPAEEKQTDSWNASSYDKKLKKQNEQKEQNERISRYFLISVLQGVVDRRDMIKLPEGTKISEESRYIQFSYAEGWLKNNQFGTFEEMLEKDLEIPVRKGDTILTAMHVTRDDRLGRSEYDSYCNDRGIGDRNRTHGVSVPAFEFMQINKILKSAKVKVSAILYNIKAVPTGRRFAYDNEKCYKIAKDTDLPVIDIMEKELKLSTDDYNAAKKTDPSAFDAAKAHCEAWGLWDKTDPEERPARLSESYRLNDIQKMQKTYAVADVRGVQIIGEEKVFTYVSIPTESSYYNSTNSRVNFEIGRDEYIRTNYLCSTWLKYVITTGNIGNLYIAGSSRMSYADSLKYLNKLLEKVREQEEKDKELLVSAGCGSWLNDTPEWDRILVEWRIENNIQKLNIRSAKKFATDVEIKK